VPLSWLGAELIPLPRLVTLPPTIPAQGSRGYRVHTLLCRGSGLPVQFLVSPANRHDALFARPLLELAVRLYRIRPRIIRLDAASWGLQLIHWIHATLGAIAVVPWNRHSPKESLMFATDVDQRGIGQTQFH
jgi:hypothetical protein